MTTHVLVLPYPPSANANWKHGNGRVYLAEPVKRFRRAVKAAMAAQRPGRPPEGEGRLVVKAKELGGQD